VASTEIGKLVMDKLREVDEVAYIRFASVYRRFRDVGDFMEELKKLSEEKK
ncbi:MAG: transcriptional regulator NrdR, partial [Clostridia bacterium]|nr:transcriptional regulator NrdR [Clostridia bacterium]